VERGVGCGAASVPLHAASPAAAAAPKTVTTLRRLIKRGWSSELAGTAPD